MNIKFHYIAILFFFTNITFAQVSIIMDKKNDVYTIPCKVNGLELDFIFDTGASNVSLSLTEALFMLKNGKLNEEDIIGSSYAQLANGDITENTIIIIKEIEISGLRLNNIRANIVHKLEAPLLLGQSAISKLGKIELDGNKLTILTKEYNSEKLSIALVQKFSNFMPVSCINVSPDKKIIAIADDTEDPLGFKELKETLKISILNSKTYSKKLELKGHLESIEAISFSYDSKYIVSSDQSGVIIIWDLSNGKQITKIETSGWVNNVKFTNLGNEIIAIQGFEKRALIYDTNGNFREKIDVGKQINDFEYNPITNKIYFGCFDELQVWSFLSRKKLKSLPFSGLMCMQFNHDYSQFAIGNSNGNIIIMSPILQEIYRLIGHFKPVLSISYSLDNSKLASASSDQTSRIWDLKKQKQLIKLVNEHNGTVNTIKYISDKNDFITGGENKVLKIWK